MIPSYWDFVPNLGNDANFLTVPWNGNFNWLRNPNSSTASALPIFWTPDVLAAPAVQDISVAQLWVVILPSTGFWIRLVHMRDGFNAETISPEQPTQWPGYGWTTARMDLTQWIKDLALSLWQSGSNQPGHHLAVQIKGQADIRRATLTIQ